MQAKRILLGIVYHKTLLAMKLCNQKYKYVAVQI